jgi:hypothetical protein
MTKRYNEAALIARISFCFLGVTAHSEQEGNLTFKCLSR